ncbi:uncharacterized protein LOC128920018 [Zeugodacus cucurbitae]|uniref:uncharacterized protein LOC128920018 n=1 Tax=Zeugodacus cucurbitae TaxID=28588 RepID=UPI0023D93F37|nr:uncharacterized protein LOC128920018 [Zeugodacus cucurbitae]
MVNIKGKTIEYIFQTSYGALKVRKLIGVTYGSSVSKRWNMCCKQIQNYGCKRCYMEHKSFTHQISQELEPHGLGDFVTVYRRDVCQLGFANELEGKADAVFLDLPAPQLAIPAAETSCMFN